MRFYEDRKVVVEIVREMTRTVDTDGCYNPYNKSAASICEAMDECRRFLEKS